MGGRLIRRPAGRQSPNDALEHLDHIRRLVTDLCAREAESLEAGGGMGLVPPLVHRLLRRGAVVAKAVGLDDETQIGPVEIDAISV
jgi:hypothetical protein